jgi:hypothetical protein
MLNKISKAEPRRDEPQLVRRRRRRLHQSSGQSRHDRLICVPSVLSKAEVAEFLAMMDIAAREEGRSTVGPQLAEVARHAATLGLGAAAAALGRRSWSDLQPVGYLSRQIAKLIGAHPTRAANATAAGLSSRRCWACISG